MARSNTDAFAAGEMVYSVGLLVRTKVKIHKSRKRGLSGAVGLIYPQGLYILRLRGQRGSWRPTKAFPSRWARLPTYWDVWDVLSTPLEDANVTDKGVL